MVQPRLSATVPRRSSSPQHPVHGRARRARHLGEVLLRHRDGRLTLAYGEVSQATADARLGVGVVRLDDAVAGPRELLGEQSQEPLLHPQVLWLPPSEVAEEDLESLRVVQRLQRLPGASMPPRAVAELAEHLALAGQVEPGRDRRARRPDTPRRPFSLTMPCSH